MKLNRIVSIGLFIIGHTLFCFAQNTTIIHEDSSRFSITRLGINTTQSDFCPVFADNKLFFASGRAHLYGPIFSEADTARGLEDVFYADKFDSINFKHPKYFSEKANNNDGPFCFNKSGDVMYISGTDEDRVNKNKELLSIFIVKKIHGKWGYRTPLPFCIGTNAYCHPTLMADGKTLIFASDMPDGLGGMDLYKSTFEKGNWSTPQNLGLTINSSSNEVFPFISAGNNLYFSSNKLNIFGVLHFYKINLTKPTSSEPELLPPPFFSTKNDFGIWVDSSETSGYFSSNRVNAHDDEIYYFTQKYPDFENCQTQKKPIFCYTFFEESTLRTEDTLGMAYEWDLGDGTKIRGLKAKHCFKSIGNYSIRLNIIDKSSGALFYNESNYDFYIEEDPKQIFIDCPDTIATGKAVTINCRRSIIPGHTIKETYWYFGDEKYAAENSVQHIYKKDGEYTLQLGILAKNDSSGKIKKFCLQKNLLVKDSLWVKSHTSTITKSNWPPPHKEDPMYHISKTDSTNFRVHLGSSTENIPTNSKVFANIKDVKKYTELGIYRYTSGNLKNLRDAIPYYRKAREKGFKDAAVLGFYGDSLIPHQEKSMKGAIPEVISFASDSLTNFHTYTIWFDFDKSALSPSCMASLDSLGTILNTNKKLNLIIIAISDSVGSTAYNFKLSQRRANTVQQYLLQKGIKEKRLEIIPLGENVPTKYKQQKNIVLSNRRVELLLVKKSK